jgi:hypothetical protein
VKQHHKGDRSQPVVLLVCAIVVGNMFPIVERPYVFKQKDHGWNLSYLLSQHAEPEEVPNPNGYLGKAIVGKADTHIVIVAKDLESNSGMEDPLPCLPSRWGGVETFTEVVLQDGSQAQPLGYVIVQPSATCAA